MTKLEVGKEYWIKAKITENDGRLVMPYRFAIPTKSSLSYWVDKSVEAVEVIPEREKVKIPKGVADWIEECKQLGLTLHSALQDSDDVNGWLDRDNNEEVFARAWLDGYEIEEEPLGVLLVDMPTPSYWKYIYLYVDGYDKYDILGSDEPEFFMDRKAIVKVTEKEAKEKYPNFKWVSLEELEKQK